MKTFKVFAGDYWTDGGAMMGVLPWAIWGTRVPTDERRRKKLSLNLLLIVNYDRVILVDSGLGNRLSERQMDIFKPSEFLLPASLAELGYRDVDVTDVIMTHLHFDHAGGLITAFSDGDRLTFPNANVWVQHSEWETAKHPDGLNRAAYDFDHQLALVESSGLLRLIDGSVEIAPGVKVDKVGGHSVGSQIVEIDAGDKFWIYAGDIIPTMFHTSLAITSAYDICRKDTFRAKQRVYQVLKDRGGYLLLDHDNSQWEIPISELKV
ncbi:MAG TPA: MBL fold metallo-hydrolase [Candidatus Cloacimonadota bacterium]|nr:MBL fold metallo-hydrolase [Candidatus Cloacimonadota bacterium]